MKENREILQNQNIFWFTEQVTINKALLDSSGHVNNSKFITPLCENGRIHYSETLLTGGKNFTKMFGLLPVIRHVEGDYLQQLFEGDMVTVRTAAEDRKSHMLFTQQIIKNGRTAGSFQFVEVLIDRNGKICRIPQALSARLDEINTKNRDLE